MAGIGRYFALGKSPSQYCGPILAGQIAHTFSIYSLFMSTLIFYDVPEQHTEVRNALTELGYKPTLKRNQKSYALPPGTLYHVLRAPEQAVRDLAEICIDLNVHLSVCGAAKIVKWTALDSA
jgi:hypothetical protein